MSAAVVSFSRLVSASVGLDQITFYYVICKAIGDGFHLDRCQSRVPDDGMSQFEGRFFLTAASIDGKLVDIAIWSDGQGAFLYAVYDYIVWRGSSARYDAHTKPIEEIVVVLVIGFAFKMGVTHCVPSNQTPCLMSDDRG